MTQSIRNIGSSRLNRGRAPMASNNTGKVLPWKPRTFTSAEAMLDEVRTQIFRDGRKYKDIAIEVGVSHSTISNVATGKTRWPRHTTLFPLLSALGYRLELRRD